MTQEELETKFREFRSFLRDELGDMRTEFKGMRDEFKERVDGVNDRLDVLNGRTRTSEMAIAVLNDRSERAEAHARLWGGGAGAVVGALLWVVKWVADHP